MNIENAIAALNSEQRQAVDLCDSSILVMAPVGTGKTNVITLRAANAIGKGVPPDSMLCLSFTNKAAREMRDRLFHFLGHEASGIAARTFHGLCASILRVEAPTIGLDGDSVIFDEEDCRELLGRLWRQYGVSVPKEEWDAFEFMLFQAVSDARLSRYEDAAPRKPQDVFEQILANGSFKALNRRQDFHFPAILRDYMGLLRDSHALDFTDLIFGVNLLFDEHPESLARWQHKYRWIQVDEVQDTNCSEYRILAKLAAAQRNLSFFGDVDQTIYEWRGSAPFEILERFKAEFAPVTEIGFVRNYRSTRNILSACAALMTHREILPQIAEDGEKVTVFAAEKLSSEAAWIADRIRELHAGGVPYREIAILTRTNFTLRDVSRTFERLELPHVKVDEYKFFQRAEIKAALAHLKILVNAHDSSSIARFLETPPKGIGEATIKELRGAPRNAGLKIGDLLDADALADGDPFCGLMEALEASEVVVFDVETTGLNVSFDEIVQVAAARCGPGGVIETFEAFLRPSFSVGATVHIHGFTDEFLCKNGIDAMEALRRFQEFCGGAVLCGHNIFAFDLPILTSQMLRLGMGEPEYAGAFDTLDLTRRFHRLQRYTLSAIAKEFQFAAQPSHDAKDDVAATAELLLRMRGDLVGGALVRREAVLRHRAKFAPLAERIRCWRERARIERPYEVLGRILDESGLAAHYQANSDGVRRVEHLKELLRLFEKHDEPGLPPLESLANLLNTSALGNGMDRYMEGDDRVLLLTAHQAKGLEFDTVFIAGATDDEFPSYRSKREDRVEEEHRLFYVAVSRARKRLFLSYPEFSKFGRPTAPSRYLRMLPESILQRA